jgi:hypothetical protein
MSREKNLRTDSKWISVDEALPKTDVEILFVSEGRVKFGEYIWYDPDYRWLDSLVHLYRYDVQYWMPLPKPPTGDKA